MSIDTSRMSALSGAAMAFVVATGACGTDGTGPTPPPPPPPPPPAPMVLRVDQVPTGAGGAIVLITGPGRISLSNTSAGFQARVMDSSLGSLRVLLRGALAPGILGLVQVADVNATYSVTVLEAASGALGQYAQIPTSLVQLRLLRQ